MPAIYKVARGARLVIPYSVLDGDVSAVQPAVAAVQRRRVSGQVGVVVMSLSGPKFPVPFEARVTTPELRGGFNIILTEAFTAARDPGEYQLDVMLAIGEAREETDPAVIQIYNTAASPA